MKNLDLEKLIIIVSLILIPVAGWWIYSLREELKVADRELAEAREPTGIITKIYATQKLIDDTKQELERQGGKATVATTYFRNRMSRSLTKGSSLELKVSDLKVDEQQAREVRAKRNRPGFQEVLVDLHWGKSGKMFLPRQFINAYVVNCESQSPIWKLQALQLVNKDRAAAKGRSKVPAAELPDDWQVRKMAFVRRKPMAKAAKKKS